MNNELLIHRKLARHVRAHESRQPLVGLGAPRLAGDEGNAPAVVHIDQMGGTEFRAARIVDDQAGHAVEGKTNTAHRLRGVAAAQRLHPLPTGVVAQRGGHNDHTIDHVGPYQVIDAVLSGLDHAGRTKALAGYGQHVGIALRRGTLDGAPKTLGILRGEGVDQQCDGGTFALHGSTVFRPWATQPSSIETRSGAMRSSATSARRCHERRGSTMNLIG
jgi:hypothetical protein